MIQKFESKIRDIKNISPTVKVLRISVPDNFKFLPGQYISLIFTIEDKRFSRSYSIASNGIDDNSIELCIKLIENGKASNLIKKLKVGNTITALGPAGGFVLNNFNEKDNLVFLSTGTGIVPFISMINSILNNNPKQSIYLIQGTRYKKEMIYKNELEELSKRYPNFKFNYILSRPENMEKVKYKGHIQDFIKTIIPKKTLSNGHFYVCGLNIMITDVKNKLIELGVDEKNIFFEKYD